MCVCVFFFGFALFCFLAELTLTVGVDTACLAANLSRPLAGS